MPHPFIPDMKFEKYSDITPDFLISQGVSALLIDIDNTLAPYEQPSPDAGHFEWLSSLASAGISCALVSNNGPERVSLFAEKLGIPALPDCGKPRTKHLRRVLKELGVSPENAAILGDQIFTDCLAARRMGMRAYIVPPIKDKRTLFFRFKRALEKPFMKRCRVYDGK